MSLVKSRQVFVIIKATNTIQRCATDRKGETFKKLWIYPAKAQDASNKLVKNVAPVLIGEYGDTYHITTDELDKDDGPMKIELPVGQTMKIEDVIVQGTKDDGLYLRFT